MIKCITLIILLLSSSLTMAQGSYTAVISCGMQGQNINVLACFTDTELKITRNNSTRVYKAYDLQQIGQTYQDGLHIELPENFTIIAQNSQDTLVLGVKIFDKNNRIMFDDQAGKWGVISVKN
jgi:hypothetical protein